MTDTPSRVALTYDCGCVIYVYNTGNVKVHSKCRVHQRQTDWFPPNEDQPIITINSGKEHG